jgi:hypothetical protein
MYKNKDLPILRKYIEFSQQLNKYLTHFPKEEKNAMCKKIRDLLYSGFITLNDCINSNDKKKHLYKLDKINKDIHILIYLAKEQKYFGNTSSGFKESLNQKRSMIISNYCTEIGKMVGGWINSISM